MEQPTKKERVVFQGAIEIWRDENRNWKRLNPYGDIVDADPTELKDQLGLLPIQYTYEFPWSKPILLPPEFDALSWRRIVEGWMGSHDLTDAPVLHYYNNVKLQDKLDDLNKMIYNSLYHIKNLIRVCTEYLDESVKMNENHRIHKRNIDLNSMTGNWFDPFYEIEATISTVIRSFEMMRFTLWFLYGDKKKHCPRKFEKTYSECPKMPNSLRGQIDQCWNDHLKKAKAYRDCINHNATIDALGGRAYINESPIDYLSLFIPIPQNPETKSRGKFTFSKDLDGLDYCWRLVNQLVDVSRAIVADVEKPAPAATNLRVELVR